MLIRKRLPSTRCVLLIAALAVAPLPSLASRVRRGARAASELCLPEFETTFAVTTALGVFTYSLSSLCSPTGYTLDLSLSKGYTLSFNIGGDSPRVCTPDSPQFAYNSRGAVLQFLTIPPPQPPGCANPQCYDWDNNSTLRCCDATCFVLATDWLSFSQLTPSTPASSGFRIDYPPAIVLADDPNPCPMLPPPNGLIAPRTVALEVACDPLAGPGLSNLSFSEPGAPSCNYVISASSAYACPVPAVPSLSASVSATPTQTPSNTATATPSASSTVSATESVTATPSNTATATPSTTVSASASTSPAVIYASALDRDAGLFVGGSLLGVVVALVSVALSQRGFCDCFRQQQQPQQQRAEAASPLIDREFKGAGSLLL